MDKHQIERTINFIRGKKHEAEDKMAVELSKIKNDFEAETGLSVSDLYAEFYETKTLGEENCHYIISSVRMVTDDIRIT